MITQERLRLAATKLRTTSMPLADLIPLLQQAADELDRAQPVRDSLHDDIQSILFEVEQAIGNGCCPWQIEAAFEAYEAARRLQLPDHGIPASPKPKD